MTKISLKSKASKFFTILFVCLCLTLCISFADLFSSLITVGGYNNNLSKDIAQEPFTMYAVSLFKSETKSQANDMSNLTKRKNGAGFIWQGEKFYYVLASCYENEMDANKVSLNLKENNVENEIIKLKFNKIKLNTKANDQEKTALNNAVLSYKNLYKKLYDISVSIDTNLYTEIQSKILVGDVVSYFSKINTDFLSLFNLKLTSQLLNLKLSFQKVQQILDNLTNFSSTTIPYTSQVKYSYFDILNEYKNLAKQF